MQPTKGFEHTRRSLHLCLQMQQVRIHRCRLPRHPSRPPLHLSPRDAGARQPTPTPPVWVEWNASSPLDNAENGALERAVLVWGRATLVKWVWGLSHQSPRELFQVKAKRTERCTG